MEPTLILSEAARLTAGVLLITIVLIETGGLYLLSIVGGRVERTPFQIAFARAGHAHAGVLVTLALVIQLLADAVVLDGPVAWLARSGVAVAAILMPTRVLPVVDGSGRDSAEPAGRARPDRSGVPWPWRGQPRDRPGGELAAALGPGEPLAGDDARAARGLSAGSRPGPWSGSAVADPLPGTMLPGATVRRSAVRRPALRGAPVGRSTVCRERLGGSALSGSALGRVRLNGSTLRSPALPLMKGGRRAPRSGVPAAIRRRTVARAPRVGSAATQPTTQDRLGADGSIGLEAGDDLLRDRCAQDALDLAEELQLIDADQRDGVARRAGTPRPADAVDVVLGDHRQLEVDDVGQAVDVEAARGDLGGDEDRRPAGLEVGQRADALPLALVAVDRDGGDAVPAELLGEPVGAVLGAGEHERLIDGAGADEVAEELALALAVDRVDDLRHERRGGVARRDLDGRGVAEEPARERADVVGERGREQQVLPLRRQDVEDLADVADEAHVEHAIGLVEDEDLDRREVDGALAEVVEQAAGRGDDDIGAAAEGLACASNPTPP